MTAIALPRMEPRRQYHNQGVSMAASALLQAFQFEREVEVTDARTELKLEPLTELYLDCRQEDWDCYGAKAISYYTYENAKRVLDLLPTILPNPEVSAYPDGDISFEWFISKTRSLDLSVDADGKLSFVALLGDKRRKGSEKFTDTIPEDILGILYQLYPENTL